MPTDRKESPHGSETLSRFFHKNLDTLRTVNVINNFEELSEYFLNPVKRKKAKRKTEFKGFPVEDQEFSRQQRTELDAIVLRCSEGLNEGNWFLGVSSLELDWTIKLREKLKKLVRSYEKSLQGFRGFTPAEQFQSKTEESDLLELCTSISSNIYKHIDRRILANHIKEEDKLVVSKYWLGSTVPVKREDNGEDEEKNWKLDDRIEDERRFITTRKNSLAKVDLGHLDRETVILSEIQRLNQELTELRKIKYATSETIKLQKSPFIQIKKELVIRPFIPPKSPHHLLEEDLYHDPWALLVATIFLNKTSARTARPYVFWFLEENPDPLTVLGKKIEQLETYFGALGLQKTRATQVWRMSHDFLHKQWTKVSELYGVGRYAEDAFRMFCLGDFSVEPRDRFLKIYKAWYEQQEKSSRLSEMNA